MESTPLVSVIVPIYDVELHLAECVESIRSQTYTNLEIILVDDGSPDACPEMCDEFAKQDNRIKVIHKQNGGLSDARNAGLREAKGEWIAFVDSDDYISSVFIEALLSAAIANGCKIAAIPFGKTLDDGNVCALVEKIGQLPIAKCMETPEVQEAMLYQELDTGAPWRLYSRDCLGADPFPVGLYYEDLASVYKIIHGVDAVAVLDCRELYAYRMRPTSIIRQAYKHIKAQSALKISEQLYADITRWYPDLASATASRCFSVCRMVYAQIPSGVGAADEMKEDRAKLWDVLVRYRHTVLHDNKARKRERLAAFIACMGQVPFSCFCNLSRKFGLMR